MDSFEKNTHRLKTLWKNDEDRQGAKIVITQAIASVSDVSAKVAFEILEELDRLLLPEAETETKQTNRGL